MEDNKMLDVDTENIEALETEEVQAGISSPHTEPSTVSGLTTAVLLIETKHSS